MILPRKPREFSTTNVYHIIFRGNDKQDIFYDDQDKYVFLDRIKETKEIFKYEVYTYCLMNNHVHMIIRIKEDFLSNAMKSLAVRYSFYFNRKFDRRGHLFENRFVSKKIENLDYFLNVCKYVHRNPENANIAKTTEYKWSSFQEYIKQKNKIINSNVLLHYFDDNLKEFEKFTLNNDNKKSLNNYAEYELISKLSEYELINIIKEKFNLKNASDVSLLRKEEQNEIIKELKNVKGITLNQVARITKVTRYYIKKLWEE